MARRRICQCGTGDSLKNLLPDINAFSTRPPAVWPATRQRGSGTASTWAAWHWADYSATASPPAGNLIPPEVKERGRLAKVGVPPDRPCDGHYKGAPVLWPQAECVPVVGTSQTPRTTSQMASGQTERKLQKFWYIGRLLVATCAFSSPPATWWPVATRTFTNRLSKLPRTRKIGIC